uniref:G protein-coupled receptor n=1 Tax=Heterorhabditis bacteriophora TaxID=37862 RepID=A0A1I7X369_HETBA
MIGYIVAILINVAIIGPFWMIISIPLSHDEYIFRYAIEHNLTHLLGIYTNQATVVYVVFELDWKVIPLGFLVFFGLFAFQAFNLISARLVILRLRENRKHMSQKNYSAQKEFITMLIWQTLYPTIAITVPVITFLISMIFGIKYIVESELLKHVAAVALLLYPCMSCTFSFVFDLEIRDNPE